MFFCVYFLAVAYVAHFVFLRDVWIRTQRAISYLPPPPKKTKKCNVEDQAKDDYENCTILQNYSYPDVKNPSLQNMIFLS